MRYFWLRILIFFIAIFSGDASDMTAVDKNTGLSIYVDWADSPNDFMDYLKKEIPWVTCTRDRRDASVFVLIASSKTGSGGVLYQIQFMGQHDFTGLSDTVSYAAECQISEETLRQQISQRLKLGLVRYASRTAAAEQIMIQPVNRAARTEPAEDHWHHWVFSLSLNGSLSGEQSQSFNYFWGTIAADRVTEIWKINAALQGSYKYNRYEIDSLTTYIDTSRSYSTWLRLVRSLGDHWSVGGGPSFRSSTYTNLKYRISLTPGIEYSFFPYEQAITREIKCSYSLGYSYQQYLEETIYDKIAEQLINQSFMVSVKTRQRWGSVYLSMTLSNYLHDFSRNNLNLHLNNSLQLVRGLSLNLWGSCGLIHDQLYLSKRGLTPEEILLQIRELSSQYEYWGGFGLTYSFGSRFSQVVNPRFD